LCFKLQKSFLYCLTGGVSGSVFVDHGDNHKVFDFNGERPDQKLIVSIEPLASDPTQALVRYDHPAGRQPIALHGGDFEITEVNGCTGINDRIFVATHPDKDPAKTVRIPLDVRALPPYVSGGLITEKKLPKPYPMQRLADKIKSPGDPYAQPFPTLVQTDLLNFGSEYQTHLGWVASSLFLERNGRLPQANSAADAAAVVEIARQVVKDKVVEFDGDVDEKWITNYARLISVEVQPLVAFFGGVLAQEVVKITGKFTPILGFLHYSCTEALPSEPLSAADVAPRGHRNDELAATFGWTLVEKFSKL